MSRNSFYYHTDRELFRVIRETEKAYLLLDCDTHEFWCPKTLMRVKTDTPEEGIGMITGYMYRYVKRGDFTKIDNPPRSLFEENLERYQQEQSFCAGDGYGDSGSIMSGNDGGIQNY